jgi:hypothetical protein
MAAYKNADDCELSAGCMGMTFGELSGVLKVDQLPKMHATVTTHSQSAHEFEKR